MKKNQKSSSKKSSCHHHQIGGQAVIEGVMMKNKDKIAVAVRKPNNKISIKKERVKPLSEKHRFLRFLKWPVIRGIVELIHILVIGIKTLNYSANESLGEKEEKLTPLQVFITIAVAFGFAFLLFKLLPLGITKFIYNKDMIGESRFVFNLIDGLLRIFIFILYIVVISFLPDIRRIFQYHGAEHKAVYCYESRQRLTVNNVKRFSTLHPRCGTTFLVLVLIIAIFVFSLVKVDMPFVLLLFYRLLLVLPIAGLSYEVLKFGARHQDNWFFRGIAKPGLWVQGLTTRNPDEKQVEVAIRALKAVI